MIAFISNFYSYSFDQVMKLPIQLFFAFYEEGVKMEARQSLNLLKIAMTPKMTWEYFQLMENVYLKMIDPTPQVIPPRLQGPALDLASTEPRISFRTFLEM